MKINHKFIIITSWVFAVVCTGAGVLSSSTHTAHMSTPPSCAPSSKLVNPCRPWLGANVGNYPGVGANLWDLKAHLLDHESRIGRQLDIVHSYAAPDKPPLSTTDKYFIDRDNTILYVTWKPSNNWAAAGGSDSSINNYIDQMADSLKSVAPKKVMLGIFHEPENDVSGGPSSCSSYVGDLGTTTEYRAMWRNVYNRMNAKGVTNVVWVMNYMGYSDYDCMIDDLWPGNDIVDWIMYDPYSDKSTWDGMVSPFYNTLTSRSNSQNNYLSKTWGIAEWGAWKATTRQHTYALYDGGMAALSADRFPRLKAYIVFDNSTSRVAYDAAGTYNSEEMAKYRLFANHPSFSNPAATAAPPTNNPAPQQPSQPSQTKPAAGSATASSIKPVITSPVGEKTVSVNAGDKVTFGSDNNGAEIQKADYYVKGKLIYTATEEPFALDTSALSPGSYSVTEKFTYKDGNTKEQTKTVVIAGEKFGSANKGNQDREAETNINPASLTVYDKVMPYVVAALVAAAGAAVATHAMWLPHLQSLISSLKTRFRL